jgi:hypothetical protein
MLQYLERVFLRFDAKLARYKRIIRLTYSIAALLAALLVSNLFDALLREFSISPFAVTAIKYAMLVFFVAFLLQFAWLALDVAFGKDPKMPPPPRVETEVRITARPYRGVTASRASEGVALTKLTEIAETEFEGDTIRPEVVQAAVINGCALGLQVKDQEGNDVGFFDFYHLKGDVLAEWLKGQVFERKLTAEDFEPISTAKARGDQTLELFVGAIVLKHRNPVYNFYFGPLLAAAAKHHLASELTGFEQVHIYASIFSKAGRRYAQVFAFEPHISGADRGRGGGGHDVYFSSFRPGDKNQIYYTHSWHNGYLLELRYD